MKDHQRLVFGLLVSSVDGAGLLPKGNSQCARRAGAALAHPRPADWPAVAGRAQRNGVK